MVRSCGFVGLPVGAWPTVPGAYVLPCAFGPAGGCVLPGVGVGLVIVGLEGLFNVGLVVVAEGLVVGFVVDGDVVDGLVEPVEPVDPVELLEPLLCA